MFVLVRSCKMYSRGILVLLVAFVFVFQMGASAPACVNRTDANQSMPTSARCCNGTCHDGGDVAKCRLDADCTAKHVCCDGKCIAYSGPRNKKCPVTSTSSTTAIIVFIGVVCYTVMCCLCHVHPDCPLRKLGCRFHSGF